MISFDKYVRAASLEEAYELSRLPGNVVAGGMMWLHFSTASYETLIDLCDLGLDRIEEEDGYLKIGSMVTLAELERNAMIKECFGTAFHDCLRHIVGIQFRNCATIGGSIIARLGFSDVITLLLPLDVKLKFFKRGMVTLNDFLEGKNEKDILEYVYIPKKKKEICFESVRKTYTDIPVLCVCGTRDEEGYRFAVGSRPAVARLVREDEEVVFGSNQRASAEYRRHLYEVLKKQIREKLEGKTCR